MLCQCGCGEEVKSGKKFVKGHWVRVNQPMKNLEIVAKATLSRRSYKYSDEAKQGRSYITGHNTCKCGCGLEIKRGNKFIFGHQNIGKKFSEEHRAKISESNKGKKLSEEAKRNLSIINKNRSSETREKLSKSLKEWWKENLESRTGKNHPLFGKSKSEEFKEKMRKAKLGENSNFWNGGINLDSYHYLDDSEEIKVDALIRDNYTCQECGKVWDRKEKRFALHHIDYSRTNHNIWNRITLCLHCHAVSNQNRPYWQEKFSLLILAKYNRLFL